MIIEFGKHKGKEMTELPRSYLLWLCDPGIYDKVKRERVPFPVAEEIKSEAKRLVGLMDYASNRMKGMPSDKTDYVILGEGDIDETSEWKPLPLQHFDRLEFALNYLAEWNGEDRLDPEDDRVTIWEILPSGHKKVVWHFSGWHWNSEEFWELDQGHFPGHEQSAYSEANI